MKHSRLFVMLLSVLILSGLIISGCQKKQEQPVVKEETTQPAPAKVDTAKKVEPAAKPEASIDLKGEWTGKMDISPATLTITKVDGNQFSGKIHIKQRDEIKQEVSGKFDKEKLTFTMKDMIHMRSAGTYAGSFDKEFKTMSGTFTLTVDNIKVKFSLKKK
ncbi:MAG: hypothetical protein LWX56_05355 [Ignavibacteria bacterium]|nr:hypothetical protein [Ignavibacteria bacterium]